MTFTQDDEVFRYVFARIENLPALDARALERPEALPEAADPPR